MNKKPLTIALLTDFGTKDWFVPVMKSVIWHIHPSAVCMDVSHEITPQNVPEASFVLWNAALWFPSPVLFVAVVDPGVGSDRPLLLVETHRHIFLAPDNGLLDVVLPSFEVLRAVMVNNVRFFMDEVSQTFHGRDIFAPVAAYISAGEDLLQFGTAFHYPKKPSPFITISQAGRYEGVVMYVDRFGNLITNLAIPAGGTSAQVRLGHRILNQLHKNFSEVSVGDLLAYRGSSGLLEIAIRNGNAAKELSMDYYHSIELIWP